MSQQTIIIKNIKDPLKVGSGGIQNRYKGRYEKIFDILNEDSIFIQIESSEEKMIDKDFHIYFDTILDAEKLDRIKNIKGVEVITKYAEGGQINGYNYSIGGL